MPFSITRYLSATVKHKEITCFHDRDNSNQNTTPTAAAQKHSGQLRACRLQQMSWSYGNSQREGNHPMIQVIKPKHKWLEQKDTLFSSGPWIITNKQVSINMNKTYNYTTVKTPKSEHIEYTNNNYIHTVYINIIFIIPIIHHDF